MGRNIYTYIALSFTIIILIGSLITSDPNKVKYVQLNDKVVHTFAYFLLTISWLLSFKKLLKKYKNQLLIALSIVIYGIIIEVLQALLTTVRKAELTDILANSVGVLFAIILFNSFLKKRMLIK